MTANKRAPRSLSHQAAARIACAATPRPPSVEAQCRAVVARLEEIDAPYLENDDGAEEASVDVRALEALPDPTGWNGRAIVPWGHPAAGGMLSREVVPVRAGRAGRYLQYGGQLYDTVRDAFVAARFNRSVSAPWTASRGGHHCGCLRVAAPRQVAAEGTIDVDAQLELMRATLRHIALAAPEIDLGILAGDLFAGERLLAEHYLWRLETDGFVDHAHDERQTSMMLTAEGCSVMLMLELTRPGSNEDVMSPEALAAAAESPEPRPASRPAAPAVFELDVPRFLTDRQTRPLRDPMAQPAMRNNQLRAPGQ